MLWWSVETQEDEELPGRVTSESLCLTSLCFRSARARRLPDAGRDLGVLAARDAQQHVIFHNQLTRNQNG